MIKSLKSLNLLPKIVILCNLSVVQADSNAPTECKISINSNALYTNNRYVTLDLYGVDADSMQVWISNDGDTGTVVDFAYNKTITITNQNYTVGVALTTSNSTTTTNSNNVLRIVNWPLSSVNGTKKVYAVFRDAYGNKTSVSGLTTISVSYNLNGVSGTTPSTVTTVKNLGVYLPNVASDVLNKSFMGWSTSSSATLSSYSANTLGAFSSNTTLYAIYKTIAVGDYVYYELDSTKSFEITASLGGSDAQSLLNSTKFSPAKQVFKVIEASASSISISPMKSEQVYSIIVSGRSAYNNIGTITKSVCGLYATDYSSSTAVLSDTLMKAVATDSDFATLFSEYGFTGGTYVKNDGETLGVNISRIGSYSSKLQVYNYGGGGGGTAYVYPVITLNTNVRFSGAGTITEPYTMMIK